VDLKNLLEHSYIVIFQSTITSDFRILSGPHVSIQIYNVLENLGPFRHSERKEQGNKSHLMLLEKCVVTVNYCDENISFVTESSMNILLPESLNR